MANIDIKKAIGVNAEKDYRLNLKEHTKRYKKTLPELVNLFQRLEIRHIIKDFQVADNMALRYQKKYRNYSKKLRVIIFLGLITSTLIITAGALPNHPFFSSHKDLLEYLIRFSAISTIIFSALGTAYIQLIKGQRYLEKWMSNRAIAEEQRIAFFETLVTIAPKKNTQLQLILLEYFRRYQLDKQINFYQVRSEEYDKKYTNLMFVTALLAGLVIIFNGVTGFLGIEYSFLASFALILQGYATLIETKENSEQYERNSARYEKLGRQLTKFRSQIDKIEKAVIQGKTSVLPVFIKAIHTPMAAEHQQWLENMSNTNKAFSELDQLLEEITYN